MIITKEVIILFILVLFVCLIGFKKYIWFISIGYGLSISAVALGVIILCAKDMPMTTLAFSILMACYGLRLGGFLAYRELKTNYNAKMKGEISDGSNMPFGVKIALWITCALLYIMMIAPLMYRCVNQSQTDVWEIMGIIIILLGVVTEAVADYQKNKAKKINPGRFCSNGLFSFVRCPNYLGELIIWTGMIISGVKCLDGAGQWIISILGYLGIVYVMFSGARRLEIRQDKNYGNNPEYAKYKENTPIMIPFVHLYSVKRHKWLVG